MTLNQLIHTSCKKGIRDSTSGFRIYSFDAQFQDTGLITKSGDGGYVNDISNLYVVEYGDEPFKINQETINIAPKQFSFIQLNCGKYEFSKCVQQRDYGTPDGVGRYGNIFKHFIICDKEDITAYPCEYYESLRDGLSIEEVSNNETPDYLPTPQLIIGNTVTITNSMEFLKSDSKKEILINMFYALLHTRETGKKIIISDTQENILQWIAALEYLLPASISKEIPFSTYVPYPSKSKCRICGVISQDLLPDNLTCYMDYRNVCQDVNRFYIFDINKNIIEQCPTNTQFYIFIKNCIRSETYGELQTFHKYVQRFENISVDKNYVNAYCLYALSKNGIASVNHETFIGAVAFLSTLDSINVETRHIVDIILSDINTLLSINQEYFVDVLTFLFRVYSDLPQQEKKQIKAIVMEQTISLYLNQSTLENQFKKYIQQMQEICEQNFVISYELLTKEYLTQIKQNLFNKSVSEWKLLYLHEILTNFGINKNIVNLERENISGGLYLDMLKIAQNKFEFTKTVLGAYVAHKEHFITLVFTLQDEFKTNSKEYWDYVIHLIAENYYNDRDWFYYKFLEHKLYHQVYALYQTLLTNSSTTSETINLFKEHRDVYLAKDVGYATAYYNVIIRDFTNRVERLVGPEADSMKKELLKTSLKNNIPVSESLPIEITKTIPMSDLSSEDRELLNDISIYYKQSKQLFTGRLRLLVVGAEISQGKNFEETISKVEAVLKNSKISLSKSDNIEGMQFLQWVVPNIAALCKTKEELNLAFEIFNFSNSDYTRKYFTILSEVYIHKINSSDGLRRLSEYILFVSEQKDEKLKSNIIRQFKKELSKKDLESMDPLISSMSAQNRKVDELWSEIYKKKSVQSPDSKSNNKKSSEFGSKDKHGLSNFFGMFKK